MATTLAQLMEDAKDLADLKNNTLVSDPTWRRWANQGKERLYRLLVTKAPARFHREKNATLTGVGDNAIPFDPDFRQLREQGITKDPDNQSLRTTIPPFGFAERDWQGRQPAWGVHRVLRYNIRGSEAVIEPAELAVGAFRYYYLTGPVVWATDGASDGSAIEAVYEPYVDFVTHCMAIKGLQKEESLDTAEALKRDLAGLIDEIQSEFNDNSDPATIIDVEDAGSRSWPR